MPAPSLGNNGNVCRTKVKAIACMNMNIFWGALEQGAIFSNELKVRDSRMIADYGSRDDIMKVVAELPRIFVTITKILHYEPRAEAQCKCC